METQVAEPKKKITFLDETRLRYVAALNFLVGELRLDVWKPLGVADFLLQYNLKQSFIDALRDLDCLILSFTKEDHYKKTDKLVKISPEEVLQQMRRNGPKSGKKEEIDTISNDVSYLKGVTIPESITSPNVQGRLDVTDTLGYPDLSIEMPDRSENGYAVTEYGHINADGTGGVVFKDAKTLIDEAEPKQPTVRKPYTVSLTAKGLDLTIEVETPADAALLDAILSNLNQ